mmetsp:Transcript_9589/g.19828  ORF Transcript_9589/g.19828 Transcript_9589/m.19828 type:complete len:151 (-) Transcript_9589:103-555(-)
MRLLAHSFLPPLGNCAGCRGVGGRDAAVGIGICVGGVVVVHFNFCELAVAAACVLDGLALLVSWDCVIFAQGKFFVELFCGCRQTLNEISLRERSFPQKCFFKKERRMTKNGARSMAHSRASNAHKNSLAENPAILLLQLLTEFVYQQVR